MSDQLKIQGVVEMSAEGAENALDRVGEKAGQMADRLQREGAKAGSAVDSIGAGADKSAEQFSRAEGKMAASIKRATTNLEQLGKTASEKLQFQINQKGLDASKFEPMLAKLREVESANVRVGMSAAQTAAALRNVPAQFTDIAVSLASGQKPMTVLLQQGGQLKDMFGGVGAAAKAVGGYVASLVNPVTIAAAAVGGLGYAFYAARAEADEFRKNLILTGNISGLTTDKFNAMAQSMANVSGITRGAAAEALTAMAASGSIGADSIERLTKSALQFEKAGGPAVAETVKQFEALGKEPLKASIELSEKTHYLTLAVYEQIKSLEEQGKASEAAALAQKTWADAIDKRTPQMVENIGLLGRAWNAATFAASGFWDAMKGIGRDDSTVEQKITALKNKIAEATASIDSGSINTNRLKQQKVQWAAELAELMKQTPEAVAEQAKAKQLEDQKIKANAAYDSLIGSQRTKNQQWRDEQKKLEADMANGLVNVATYIEATAAIRKKYEEKGGSKPKVDKDALEAQREAERQQDRLNALLSRSSGASKEYASDVALLGAAMHTGQISADQYYSAIKKLWLTQTDAGKAMQASKDAAEQANKALNIWTAEHESQLAAIAEETSAVGQNAAARKVALAGLQVEADARKKIEQLSLNLSETDRASAVAAINAEAQKQKAYVETSLRKQQSVEGAYQLEQENRRFAAESILDEKQRAQVILDIDAETWRQRIDLAEVGSEERRRLEGAFAQWYSNQLSKPAIESMRKALESIDATFHDSFTRMLENGKADWDAFGKALATSFKTAVADEIYKLTIKPIVVSVVSSFAGGASQAAGAVAGQSGSGISGVVQGVQGAYSAVNGGITNAATAFATSGVGQYLGLSTAGQAMGPPTAAGAMGYTASGATMTSSGSSAVAAAGYVAAIVAAIYAGFQMQKSGWFNDNSRQGYLAEINEVATKWRSNNDRLFGVNRNISFDATGLTGAFDLAGFEGQTYQDKSQKGGTFRRDNRWTEYGEVGKGLDAYLDSLLKSTVSGLQTIGKTLNVESTKALEGFSHQFALQLSDNGDMSKAGEKIAAEIGKVSDELVNRLVPTIGDFAQFGESATQTFQRLNQEVQATDAILLAMGKDASEAFGGVGLASIAAREDLIALAGGIDALASKSQSYYANFYSSDEQMQRAAAQAQKVLDKGFADLGLSLPTDRKGFRDLVESYGKDLSTESARKYFNALLDLQDEFNAVAKEAEATADKLKQSTTAAQQAQGSIFDTFASDTQKLEAAQKIVNDTFASIGRAVPDSAASFLELSQSLVPTDKASQDLINTLAKVSNAFAYVEKSVADTAAGITAAANAAAASRRSVMDSYDPNGAVTRAQSDINAAFARYGATAPTDRAGLAAVANSIDTNTALGREQMAALQALTGAFDTVFAARNQATSSQRSLQDSFDPSGAVARAQSDITVAFGKYGATAPTDRAGVAAVASSIDTNTALGKQQMSELAALSGAFDTVFSAQERAAQAAADAAQKAADEQSRAAKEAQDAAQRAADEQARIAQQAADEQMRLATQVHDSISSALKSLLGQSQQFEAQSRQMAQATLQSALVIAKAGGSLSNFQGLDAALESVTKLDKATFATATSYAVEFGRTANLLTQLEQYTRINGSHANGLDYVPFDGYIAQLHRGERVQTAASAAAADATVEEVKALRSDLNAIGAALAAYTQKTAKLMAKFDVEGIPARA